MLSYVYVGHHLFITYAKFSEKTNISNFSFSENFAYVINGLLSGKCFDFVVSLVPIPSKVYEISGYSAIQYLYPGLILMWFVVLSR